MWNKSKNILGGKKSKNLLAGVGGRLLGTQE